MSDDITLTWRATKFDGSPPEKDDGSCYDGEACVGRVMKEGYGPQKDLWRWSMTSTGFGRDRVTTHGREATKDAAKAAIEQSYRELVAQRPENRAYWQEREAEVRGRIEALARPKPSGSGALQSIPRFARESDSMPTTAPTAILPETATNLARHRNGQPVSAGGSRPDEPHYLVMELGGDWVVFDNWHDPVDQGDDDSRVGIFGSLEEARAAFPDSEVGEL